jgi:hypothetical protein
MSFNLIAFIERNENGSLYSLKPNQAWGSTLPFYPESKKNSAGQVTQVIGNFGYGINLQTAATRQALKNEIQSVFLNSLGIDISGDWGDLQSGTPATVQGLINGYNADILASSITPQQVQAAADRII